MSSELLQSRRGRAGWRCAVGVLAATAVVASVGCQAAGFLAHAMHEAGSHRVYAEYEGLRGHEFVVIVQADQAIRVNDPQLVVRVTNGVTRMLSNPEVGTAAMVPGLAVLTFQYDNPSWPTWSYARLANEFTVDRLVLVDLYEYRLYEPGNRHLWAGRAAARVSVYEAERGGEDMAFTHEVQVALPDGTYTRAEMPEEGVSNTLQNRLINRIAWLMFDHDEKNTIEY